MTKIDAMREAMTCLELSEEARLAIIQAVENYEHKLSEGRSLNEERREEILRFMELNVPMTAQQIAKAISEADNYKYISRWVAAFSSHSVAALLKEAVKRGYVVIDHKEKMTIIISPAFGQSYEKEVAVSVYRRVI